MSDVFGAVILAGGEGKRLGLKTPKPLVSLLGRNLIEYPLKTLQSLSQTSGRSLKVSVVVGHQGEYVRSELTKKGYQDLCFAVQEKQLGTADALKSYFDQVEGAKETNYTIVMCADTPLIQSHHIEELINELKSKNLEGVAATFREEEPSAYGRIVRASKGFKIVEFKDADEKVRSITEVNSALYVVKTAYVLKHLYQIDSSNKSQEFYLTDLFQEGRPVEPYCFEESSIFMGVNNLQELSVVNQKLLERKRREIMLGGVQLISPETIYIEEEVEIEPDTLIYPQCALLGKTKISQGTVLEFGCVIKDSHLHPEVQVNAYSYLENCEVGPHSVIGPYARLRPEASIGPECKIGNFVEIKKAKLERGVKASHLTYIGDAEIGEETNIGCGVITVNYDGVNKHKTVIGKRSFIGSDCQIVAPRTIGDESFIACGSTITRDVPNGAFAISREKQVTKENQAKRFLKKPK